MKGGRMKEKRLRCVSCLWRRVCSVPKDRRWQDLWDDSVKASACPVTALVQGKNQ